MNNDTNPYTSPVDVVDGEWDHSLFWRLVKISAAFMLLFFAIDVFFYVRYSSMAHVKRADEISIETVKRFFTGWEPRKPD
jgi:hypothetical protein